MNVLDAMTEFCEFFIPLNYPNGIHLTADHIVELMEYWGGVSYADPRLVVCDGYVIQQAVVNIGKYNIQYPKFIITSDRSLEELGLSYDLKDFKVVIPEIIHHIAESQRFPDIIPRPYKPYS